LSTPPPLIAEQIGCSAHHEAGASLGKTFAEFPPPCRTDLPPEAVPAAEPDIQAAGSTGGCITAVLMEGDFAPYRHKTFSNLALNIEGQNASLTEACREVCQKCVKIALPKTQDCSKMASAPILERGFAANGGFLGGITHPYQKRNSTLGRADSGFRCSLFFLPRPLAATKAGKRVLPPAMTANQ